MTTSAAGPDPTEMRLTDDEFKQFCQVIASLLTDMVPAKTDIDLPPPLQDLISSLKMLPLSDRLSRLEDGLAGLSGIDTDAVFNCVFSVDPRRPEDDPPAPSTPAPVLHPTPNSFQIPTPIIDLKPETKYDGFETISLSALMAMEDQGVEWLVDRLIPTGSASILGGYAGQGKSWMLMDLALSVVSGLRWLGRFSTRQGQILYIDEESGIKLLRRRLGRLINGRGMSISTDGLEFVVQKGICLADKQSLGLLRGTIARTKPILVIIDSLIRVHGSEENSASDMAKVFAEIKRIIRDFGCSVLFADHQKKPGIGSVSQDLLLRGTTEKVAFVDTLLSVARKNDVLVVEHSKSRFEQPVPPFVIEIEDVAQDKTVVRVVGDAEQVQRQSREEEALAFIHNVLVGGSWKTRKEIADSAKKAGVKVRVLSELLATLTEQGVLERDDRKVNPGRGSKTAHYRKCPAANYVSDFTSTSNRENVNELETDSGDPNGTLWTESGGDPE